jgi:O-antigen ligase
MPTVASHAASRCDALPRRLQTRDTIQGDSALTSVEKNTLLICASCGVAALILPHVVVKIVLALVLGMTLLRVSFAHYYLAVGVFAFLLPLHPVVGERSFLVAGVNLQTLSALFFVLLGFAKRPDTRDELRHVPSIRNPAIVPLACLVAVLILSAVHSTAVAGRSLQAEIADIKNAFIYSLFVWLSFAHIRKDHERLVVLLFVVLGVLFNVVISLRAVAGTFAAGLIFLRHRATSLITDQPNLYGGFLALYLFFFLGLLLYGPLSRRQKMGLGISTGFVALNLLYTLSRGAWLAAALTACLVAVTKSRRMLVPIGTFVVGLMFLAPGVVVERWQDTLRSDGYSLRHLTAAEATIDEAASRIIQWRTLPEMFLLNPMMGIGKGLYNETHYESGYDDRYRAPHSSVIALAVEQGVFGLIFYFWLLTAVYLSAAKRFRTSEQPIQKALAFGTMAATVCLFFLDLTGTRFFSGEIMAYYWILTGMTLNIMVPSRKIGQQHSWEARRNHGSRGRFSTVRSIKPKTEGSDFSTASRRS